MATWKRLPQECRGDYYFSGQAYMTRGVQDALSPEQIAFIVADLHAFVQQEIGQKHSPSPGFIEFGAFCSSGNPSSRSS